MGDQTQCGKLCFGLKNIKPYLAMVSLQFGYAGMYIITMVAFKHGLSHYILAVYRHVTATIVMVPFAFVLERKIRPKLTLPIFIRILLLGVLEPVLDQNLYYVGMKYTSATFASATVNILPALTFVLALIFRLEKVNLKKIRSLAKVIGTAITVSGAMVMTLFKGPIINFLRTHVAAHHGTASEQAGQHWAVGTLFLLAAVCSWAAFFILQTLTLKKYPAELSLTALVCSVGLVENVVVSLVMERDMNAWKIGFDSRLLAATYSGIVGSGVAYYVQGMVIKERGPVFVTSFSPLCMIITAILGSLVLAELIHLGSIIGAILIVLGLYIVVWGKSKDPVGSTANSFTDEQNGAFELPITGGTRSSINFDSCSHGEAHDGACKIVSQSPVS